MNIAIIPARIGSKRLPKKNIKSFLGKPMIYYAILAAKKSKLFEKGNSQKGFTKTVRGKFPKTIIEFSNAERKKFHPEASGL